MTLQSLRARREERRRQRAATLARFGGPRGIRIAEQLVGQPQEVIQPSVTPAIPEQAQAEFEAAQTEQRTARVLGGDVQVGAPTAAPETRGKPEFGDFFGSGVLENVVGDALPALENLQKGLETFGGAAVATAGQLTPGDLFGFEGNLARVREEMHPERGGVSGLFNITGQAQELAEAFRETNMPSFELDIIPGSGLDLPGDATLNEISLGVKGAIELLPEVLVGIATGGGSATASVARRTGTSVANALGADIAKAAVKGGAKAVGKVTATSAPDVVKRTQDAAGSIAKLSFSDLLSEISDLNSPELRQRISDMPLGFAASAFWNVASPIKIADTSRAAVVGTYAWAKGIDRLDKLSEVDMAILVDKVGLSAIPQITDEVVGKAQGVPFTVTSGGLMKNTGIPSIDDASRPWTEVSENFFKRSKTGEITGVRKSKKYFPDVDIGTWDQSARDGIGAYVPADSGVAVIDSWGSSRIPLYRKRIRGQDDKVDGSELATFLRHYQDSIYGVRLHFEGLGGKIKGTTVLDEITSFYTPRNAETGTNLYTEAEKINAGLGVPGRKGRQFKERSFSNESLAEMIERGDYKLAGPMETMREHIRSTYKAGLDLEMKKYMQAAAKEPNTGLIDMVPRKARVRGAMARIRQGKVLQSGERSKVTEKTIKLIENEFPAVGRKLRDAQEIDAPVKRGKAIDDIVKTFDQDVLELNKQYFVPASGAADVAAGVRKEDRIPAYAGILFESKADADRVVEIHGLKDKGMFASIAEWSAQASDLLRVGRTGFDFGVWMIQGLPALGLAAAKSVSPGMAVEATETTAGVTNRAVGRQMLRAWGKSVPVAFKAFTDENYMLKILMQDTDLLTEAAGYGLQFSRSATDVFQAIQRGTILRKGGTAGKRIDELITKAAKPFERAFVAPGDFIRLQYYKALRPSAALKGEDGLRELAAVLNNMTGALSSSALGITPSLQRIERGFLFYSPRYTRASMALLADVFKGNVQGRIARESLIGLLGLGVSSYIVTVQAMRAAGSKQELHLDPSSSKFMTIDIGGDNIGVGGFWTQFAKVVTRVAETAWDADAREMFFDPQGGTDVVRNNPLIRWIRSRSAPFPGIGWDIAAGEDFLGRQIESPIDWAKHTQAQTTPIWFESAFLTDPYTSGLSGTVSEVVGARTRPLSSSERRRNLRNSLAVEAYDMTWEDLNGLQRDRINEGTAPGVGQSSVSDLAQLNERVLSERADKGEEKDIIIEKYHRKHRDIENKWQEHVQDGIDFLDAGAIDLRQFRDIYLTASNAIRRDAWEALSDPDGDFALAIEHFEENAKKFGEDNPEDVAYNEYITAIIGTDAFDDPEGFNFRRRDEAVLAFRNKWGDEVFAYVQGRFAEGRAMPKIVSEFYQGRQRFEYYWRDVEEATLASVPMSDSVAASYQEWLEGTANEKFELEETAPGLKRFLKKMSSVRVSLRERDRLLDAWLFRWGYTDTFRHPDNEFSPDGAEARDYWRNSMPFPLETFGIQSGVAL